MSEPMEADKTPKIVCVDDLDIRDIVVAVGIKQEDVKLLTAIKQHAFHGAKAGAKDGVREAMETIVERLLAIHERTDAQVVVTKKFATNLVDLLLHEVGLPPLVSKASLQSYLTRLNVRRVELLYVDFQQCCCR